MAFTGKYVLESQENGCEFLKAIGMADPKVSENIITDIYQNDTFRMTKFFMDRTWSNVFSIGKESELETMDGEKFKTTVTLNCGKLKIEFPKYVYTAEVVDDKLIEINTIGTIANKLVSKKANE